ncbi:Aspartate aminotransferase [Serratia entomophila]|uniref:pyridoxal phosphate-dependent aminotransferase n=1 Tax=Serratia entomophila TaxID=42906 RepID=UPI002179C715|nr:pyridoxal phosphate-dependent aminotransferase [Serratia entomophila]CAI0925757.1 Aspartate aminotransferase [Serratia entomophila]CAI0929331.1 Aspartate aminotransferase [Serratia entomophila]CAI2098252.1 Aspartate aminotransferase [Serratia entomophila]
MSELLFHAYKNARNVLSGNDETGMKVFPGMFDSDVISLSHGDGTRRPQCGILSAGVLALLDDRYSPDDYHVMTHNAELETWIIDDFKADGIHESLANNIVLSHGSTSLFDAIFTYYIGKGRRYLVPSSFYHNLIKWSVLYHEHLTCQYTKIENDYKLTAEELSKSVSENDIDTLFLFNPTQTGAIYTDAELMALSKVCIEFNITVFVDSVFSGTEFNEEERTPQMAKYFTEYPDNIVTIKSASKFLNLANVRVGWACGGSNIIAALRDICSAKNPSISNVALEMVKYGVLHCHEYIRENNQESAQRARIIDASVYDINNSLGEQVINTTHKPAAGHGFLLDFDYLIKATHGRIKSGCDLVAYLLKEQKLSLSPADSLGFTGCKVRVAFSSVGLKSTYLDSEYERNVAMDSITIGRVPVTASRIPHRQYSDYFDAGRGILDHSLRNSLRTALSNLLKN